MQTIWVLMAETGFVEPPFILVKSYRRTDRRGRPAVAPVELGIETFYKVYKAARPRQVTSEDLGVVRDPGKFRTERMRRLFVEARRFASLNVPVLLLGERGTGKTMLASWIRLHSPFRQEVQDDRWPAVACRQYSPETMRAELFGYRKGAFTGATSDREGLLAAADRDTLFLDEVGDVSRDLQRLLIHRRQAAPGQVAAEVAIRSRGESLVSASASSRVAPTLALHPNSGNVITCRSSLSHSISAGAEATRDVPTGLRRHKPRVRRRRSRAPPRHRRTPSPVAG